MIDLSWKIFSQTGNIEAYLLMKELETVYDKDTGVRQDIELTELDM
ncbi:YqzL family protein [Aquibacillus koreensis]|uniref:YqzL family protein n=1 Tax=Aquibacillus koreensis TaxID=279446 RepID=A0A9X3WIC5_9BACI|nr:YqzL family protein [Aquibacillus koreensis]MCT2537594.1 YqzL family protein [Aquibacillus koreensis]MDC3419040.1 YqzL family protein [Aquibacillus koreensis]